MSIGTIEEYDIATNGLSLHVTEQGAGEVVLFCHGFPDTAYTWRRQMHAVATAGYRAIAPDMRGYGRSSAPEDASCYTPLHTAGDLVGLLDALKIESATLVGHDWGATHVWNAALLRPDRFKAVFCLSVPYLPRGNVSIFDKMRSSGHQSDFYMFEQIRPDADRMWADAAVTIPGVLYWASASAPADQRWAPLDPTRSLHRPSPGPLPTWADPDSRITQPAFFIWGKADGLKELYPTTIDQLKAGIPGLVEGLELDDVGHWVQHEASHTVSGQLVKFLRFLKT